MVNSHILRPFLTFPAFLKGKTLSPHIHPSTYNTQVPVRELLHYVLANPEIQRNHEGRTQLLKARPWPWPSQSFCLPQTRQIRGKNHKVDRIKPPVTSFTTRNSKIRIISAQSCFVKPLSPMSWHLRRIIQNFTWTFSVGWSSSSKHQELIPQLKPLSQIHLHLSH